MTKLKYLCIIFLFIVFGERAFSQGFGTPERPFSENSPWNSRPVSPKLGEATIPKSDYFPAISEGAYSTGIFVASAEDTGVDIYPRAGKPGVWDPDSEIMFPVVHIKRWPAGVIPALGSDGHADIIDPFSGIIHSFWQLVQKDGQWQATQYFWTSLNGRGWGDPAHYFQGARAAGVPTTGGLIRKFEVRDGQAFYKHALAMSLTYNGLSPDPSYVFPATSADNTARSNTGSVPEGALLMLPSDYDTQRIANAALRKVAETLKVFGAYVVDRNTGTPFVIYVENGSDFKLHGSSWDSATGNELQRIRAELRPLIGNSGWLDGNGQAMLPERNLNILSMRGPWKRLQGKAIGEFQTLEQAVVFPPTTELISQANLSGQGLTQVYWAKPVAGHEYRFAVNAKGDAKLRMQLQLSDGKIAWDSGNLENGQISTVIWPEQSPKVVLIAQSGVSGQSSQVSATLIAISTGTGTAK